MDIRQWPELQAALPPLSSSERDDLAQSITERGVIYPVLVMPDGRIIDGHHRWELSGGTADFRVLDVDEETGFALGIALNLFRRQMNPARVLEVRALLRANKETAKRVIAEMDKQGKTQEEIAAAVGLTQQSVSNTLKRKEEALSNTKTCIAKPESTDRRSKRAKIPLEDHDAIIARRDAGEHLKDIARDYNTSASAIVQYLKRYAELGPPSERVRPNRRFTDEEEETIEGRYRTGEARETLAEAYGCNSSTITNIIHRVRERRGISPPPPVLAPLPTNPKNVVDFPTKQQERRIKDPIPERRRVPPEVIQGDVVRWLELAQKVNKDQFQGLISRYDEDALVAALATSAEGDQLVRNLEEMVKDFRAFVLMIRRGNAGQETRKDGSTNG